MEKVQTSVAWYQQKIGSYDRQLWEQSVEQKVLKNIQQAPKRVVRAKTDLIDVDLVRGSTFTKAKPQVPWTYITLKTFSRVLLFPFHYNWWIQQTSLLFMSFLLVLYLMQVITIIVFFNNVGDQLTQDEQSLSEVAIPCILMVLLGLIHSQTVLTHLKPPVRDNKRDGWRRKRSLSQNRGSVSNIDVIGTASNVNSDLSSNSQSRSSMKGHHGSRPLRERTKERKVRLKPNNQRPSLRRENAEIGSQDSESAYHTHEASDSIADRTSSLEHDSNGSLSKGQTKSQSLDLKLDISPRVNVTGCDNDHKMAAELPKTRESQESDFPQDSNSDDEKLVVVMDSDEKSKRNSQSISSDNEDDEATVDISHNSGNNEGCFNGNKADLEKKILFEGVTVSHRYKNGELESSEISQMESISRGIKGEECESSFLDISLEHSPIQEIINGASDLKIATNESNSSQKVVNQPSCQSSKDETIENDFRLRLESTIKPKYSTNSSVHFTNDPVQLREITPKSSREGTPTHTQSDVLLQSKRKIRGSNLCKQHDTESESDIDVVASKILPNVRRRKVTVSESASCEGTGTLLRNRRKPLRETKTNSTTGVSSSEGETEGQSSEYSRGSRRNMASSEEWGDHLQSDVDSTSEETSSCGSEPEISQHEDPVEESDGDTQNNCPNLGMTTSNLHAMNILTTTKDIPKKIRFVRTKTLESSSTSNAHPPDKVTCIIWERNECKKVELTALDIGWAIIETVDKIPESSDYIFIGLTFSLLMGLTPFLFVAFHSKDLPSLLSWDILKVILEWSFSIPWMEMLVHLNAAIQRFCLSAIFFFLLSVADRTFKQRLLYAKHFCYLTSSRRARKFDLPHLRLNKVRNIRTWLSLRSYLKKRGPQRSVDVIVSSAFLFTLIMLIFMCLQLLREAETYLNFLVNWELLLWCMALGVYLLRFMTLGLRINKKYRNLSVLITEQINLYLQMEQKPHKKEELMVANNVLKLAESLLKELESPFKISGISANPLILNVTKVVVLSAFSAVLTELLGFKLKLYKIKLRA